MNSNLVNIEEYYNEVKDKYPGVNIAQFEEICRYPFKYVKYIMSSGVLKDIRLQYFGVFEVSKSKVKYVKKILEENFKEKKISEERYNRRIKVLNSYED